MSQCSRNNSRNNNNNNNKQQQRQQQTITTIKNNNNKYLVPMQAVIQHIYKKELLHLSISSEFFVIIFS